MKRIFAVFAIVIAMSIGLVGCGSTNSSGSNSSTSSNGSTSSTGSDNGTSAASFTCPTDGNTKSFAKTRFLADVGLIVGTFHHFLWKPYQAGSFNKGAHHRIFNIIKAGAAALFISHETKNAVDNVKASPLLCRSIGKPLASVSAMMGDLVSKVKGGDFSTLAGINGGLGSVTGLLGQGGNKIKETVQNVG